MAVDDVNIRHYVIGIIIFAAFISFGVYMMTSMYNDKSDIGGGLDVSKFNKTFNKQAEITGEINKIEHNISDSSTSSYGTFGMLNDLIQTSWSVLKLTFGSFSFMKDVFTDTTTFFPFKIPAWIAASITMIITVIIAFTIFSAIFQKDI